MSTAILVMGESGTGKSTSIRTLSSEKTFVINVLGKPLPFQSFKKDYKKLFKDNVGTLIGNYIETDSPSYIIKILDGIDKNMNNIKNIIIDDYQYVMCNEFMRTALEKGYEKFTRIGLNAWNIIDKASKLREDISVFFLSHSETDNFGKSKCKTIGKMLDDKITLEGMFTTVLHSMVIEGNYKFLTQNDGFHIAKSPMGMFADNIIDNDLGFVVKKMNEYYFEGEAA
jgi:hypothetical protein